ncbi:MAG: DUF2397 domain-containing protein [Alphaproteobacteria bacterium]|nr:DUF2397 domain-containing protein [Alphaproteobacteria bacterium]
MNKVFSFSLIASTIISSLAFAGANEYLDGLDEKGLRVALKAVLNNYTVNWRESFDYSNPEDASRADNLCHYLDCILSDKIRKYSAKQTKAWRECSVNLAKKYEEKYKDNYDKQNKLTQGHSACFLSDPTQLGVAVPSGSSSPTFGVNLDSLLENLDEKALRAAILAITNKYTIDNERFNLNNPEDVKRKDNVQRFLNALQGTQSDRKKTKNAFKRQFQQETSELTQRLSQLAEERRGADNVRKERVQDFQREKNYLILAKIAEKQLQELNSLDALFLREIRQNHAYSRNPAKGVIPQGATLSQTMEIYGESVMSISYVLRDNPAIIKLIERVFNLLNGNCTLSFYEARTKIKGVAEALGYPQINAHLSADHGNFPYLEKLTSMYCQLVDDPTNLVLSQQGACMNGLNGRVAFATLLTLKAQLEEVMRNPPLSPKTFSWENSLDIAGVREAVREAQDSKEFALIQEREDMDNKEFLTFCRGMEEEIGHIERMISLKREELENALSTLDERRDLRLLEPVDQQELEEVTPPPFTFNSTFVGAHAGIPSGYQFVVDPTQGRRRWGVRKVVQVGDGHVAVEGDGYVFYYQIPTAEMKKLHGKRFRFEGDVLSHTPGAYIQYWGYFNASSEKIKSEIHTGDSSWQRLSLDFTVDENNTRHYIYPVILPAVGESSEAPVVEVKNVKIKQL